MSERKLTIQDRYRVKPDVFTSTKPNYYKINDKQDLLDVFKSGFLARTEFRGFLKGCIAKYLFRYDKKGQKQSDLNKLVYYAKTLKGFELQKTSPTPPKRTVIRKKPTAPKAELSQNRLDLKTIKDNIARLSNGQVKVTRAVFNPNADTNRKWLVEAKDLKTGDSVHENYDNLRSRLSYRAKRRANGNACHAKPLTLSAIRQNVQKWSNGRFHVQKMWHVRYKTGSKVKVAYTIDDNKEVHKTSYENIKQTIKRRLKRDAKAKQKPVSPK